MRAVDTELNSEVAVKELQPGLADNDEVRERFPVLDVNQVECLFRIDPQPWMSIEILFCSNIFACSDSPFQLVACLAQRSLDVGWHRFGGRTGDVVRRREHCDK